MADKPSYPQIPTTVWWGVRSMLQRSPNMTIDERALGVQLDVQEAAARQYVVELRRVGILTDEGRATPVAQKWRHDETYADAVKEILEGAYPPGLLQLAPPGEADRQRVISWFVRDGLGTGTAGNKAATYMMISSAGPGDAPTRTGSGGASAQKREPASPRRTEAARPAPAAKVEEVAEKPDSKVRARPDQIPLNVNVQIHISADATSTQIESIFSAMRKYLYDGPA